MSFLFVLKYLAFPKYNVWAIHLVKYALLLVLSWQDSCEVFENCCISLVLYLISQPSKLCSYVSLSLYVLLFFLYHYHSGSLIWTISHSGTSLSLSLPWLLVPHSTCFESGCLSFRNCSLLLVSLSLPMFLSVSPSVCLPLSPICVNDVLGVSISVVCASF